MSTEHGPHTTRPADPGPYVHSPGWSGRPLTDLSWEKLARCTQTDPDLFHPEVEEGHDTSPLTAVANAKQVCHPCRARTACFAAALERRERYGVWGGVGRRAREAMWHALPENNTATKEAA